jgi:hypothetical protein
MRMGYIAYSEKYSGGKSAWNDLLLGCDHNMGGYNSITLKKCVNRGDIIIIVAAIIIKKILYCCIITRKN